MAHNFKGNVNVSGNFSLPNETSGRALIIDGSNLLKPSAVTSTELGYMSGVTSSIQTQISAKLTSTLSDGKIFIGNGSNVATEQTVSGDISLSNTGVAAISSGVIVDADVNASAAIALSKLAATTASRALVSDGSGFVSASSVTSTELGYVSGVTSSIQTQLGSKIDSSEKGANSGVATLDAGGKIPSSQLPNSVMDFKGNWDASSNTPTLADGTGSAGDVYRANVAGSQDLGSGSQTFAIGDWVVYNGSIWEKSNNSNAVMSVNSQTGVVVLDSDDISEGSTNLYFSDERAQDAVGNILTDSSTIDFTYTDGGPTISASVISASLSEVHLASGTQIPVNKIAALTNNLAVVTNASGFLTTSSVTDTELGYLSGVTSSIQTQLNSLGSITGSFSGANNQASPADVTGFAFANATYRSFDALVSIYVNATSSLYETYNLRAIQKGSSWDLAQVSNGDDSLVVFSITNAGQIQYTSANYSGFSALTIKFNARTTPV